MEYLLSNPLDSPLLLPSVYRLGGLLLGILLFILILERQRLGQLNQNVLFRRWRTWVTIAPVYLLGVLGGPLTTLLLILGLSLQGLREYAGLVELPANYRRVLYLMGMVAAPVALISLDGFYLLAPLLLILATLQPLAFGDSTQGVRHLAFAALGWGYIAWFLAHMILIHQDLPGGPGILLALGLGVAMSDVGAFTVGKALGRHQLSPRISPNKTWEGVAGNFLGAFLGVGIMGFALAGANFWLLTLVLPVVIALGSVWGDLVESAIKREFQAKDAGDWLPGFGGILDRIDSLILVLPLVYYFIRLTTG